jgi:hypothetical protein
MPAAATGIYAMLHLQTVFLQCCRYLMSLDKNPIATKAVTSAMLTLAGTSSAKYICSIWLQSDAMQHGFRSDFQAA